MGFMQQRLPLFLLLVLGGCATFPTGPSVNVLPAPGKSFETFQSEDTTCRQWAEQRPGMQAQQGFEKNVATGAVAGTAIGAGLGAAVGSASGHAGAGALIGGASGLLVGSAAGSDSGRLYGREAQRRYDNAYMQCMYTYGNQVPGYRPRVVAAAPQPVIAAPPPPAPIVQAEILPPPPESYPEPGQYSPPPEVYVDDAPQFIYSPALNLYVAVGVPYDLVYTGSGYFYFYGGRWYHGPYYNGPWAVATRRGFPPVLSRYRIDHIRRYRDAEFSRYEHNRTHYDGRFHRPEFRGERRRLERREEHR
jgi:outer membrane lipoprotein SlyB